MGWVALEGRLGKRPFILGHRGASADAPENSLAAFALAREQGADGIELDVQLSADGQLVIFHDETVERLTDGSGKVSDLSLAQLQEFKLENGEAIPTLDAVFELLGSSFLYNVELKLFGFGDGVLETAVADCIQRHHLQDQVLVSSFNPFAIRRIRKQLSSHTKVAHLWHNKWLKYKYLIGAAEANHPHYSLVDEKYMVWARRHNWMVNVWTVDDPQEAQRLADLGVDAVITNNPHLLRQALNF